MSENYGKLTLGSNFGQLTTGFTHVRAVFDFNQRQNAEGKNSRDILEQIGSLHAQEKDSKDMGEKNNCGIGLLVDLWLPLVPM